MGAAASSLFENRIRQTDRQEKLSCRDQYETLLS
jgi:hypothetical protein